MSVEIYKGRSALIPFEIPEVFAQGNGFVFLMRKHHRGNILLEKSNDITFDAETRQGLIKLLDSDTQDLEVGNVLIELQVPYQSNENYVIMQAKATVSYPLKP